MNLCFQCTHLEATNIAKWHQSEMYSTKLTQGTSVNLKPSRLTKIVWDTTCVGTANPPYMKMNIFMTKTQTFTYHSSDDSHVRTITTYWTYWWIHHEKTTDILSSNGHVSTINVHTVHTRLERQLSCNGITHTMKLPEPLHCHRHEFLTSKHKNTLIWNTRIYQHDITIPRIILKELLVFNFPTLQHQIFESQ